MGVLTKDEHGEVVQREGGSVTRMVGIGLPNGMVIQAPVEVWIAAIIQHMTPENLMSLAPTIQHLNSRLQITPLTDGMAIVNKPIIGLHV
jgi:hypothetical protein